MYQNSLLPGCCSTQVLYGFPEDGYFEDGEQEVRFLRDAVKKSIDFGYPQIVTLGDHQKIAQQEIVKHGFRAIGTYPGTDCDTITVFIRGLKLKKQATKKSRRRKRSGKK